MSVALSALTQGREWLDEHGWDAAMYLRPLTDSFAAGALLARRAGSEVTFVDPSRHPPELTGPLIIVNFGSPRIATRAPLLIVDRDTRAEHQSPNVTIGNNQFASTSELAWRLTGSEASQEWLSVLGSLSTQGVRALPGTMSETDAIRLNRLRVLCTAAERLRNGPALAAFKMLHDVGSPKEALDRPQARSLAKALIQLSEMSRRAQQVEPRVNSRGGLLELDAPADLQSNLARVWAERLIDRPVIAFNRGWRHDRVAFAVASCRPRPLDVWLTSVSKLTTRQLELAGMTPYLATGSMSQSAFERFVISWDRADAPGPRPRGSGGARSPQPQRGFADVTRR